MALVLAILQRLSITTTASSEHIKLDTFPFLAEYQAACGIAQWSTDVSEIQHCCLRARVEISWWLRLISMTTLLTILTVCSLIFAGMDLVVIARSGAGRESEELRLHRTGF